MSWYALLGPAAQLVIFGQHFFQPAHKPFGGAGLGFGFLDNIFGDFLKGRGFSFRTFSRGFGGPRGMKSETPGGINLGEIFGRAQRPTRQDTRYEITITGEQAARGLEKDLTRKGKRLRVRIPPGVSTGTKVRLRNARQVTDGQPGDIIILVKVK